MSVRPSVCLSVFLSVCQSVCLFVSLSVCLSVCQSASQSVCLFVCLSVCVCVCVSVCLSVCQCVSQSVCLSVCQSVCLSVCLSVWVSCVSMFLTPSQGPRTSIGPDIHHFMLGSEGKQYHTLELLQFHYIIRTQATLVWSLRWLSVSDPFPRCVGTAPWYYLISSRELLS